MTITGGYSSTKNVTNLAPGDSVQVTFDPWTTSSPATVLVSVQTQLTGDNFVINMNSLDKQNLVSISIFDQVSKLILTDKINPSTTEINYVVNSSAMKAGLYWIRIINGEKMVRKSIVITK